MPKHHRVSLSKSLLIRIRVDLAGLSPANKLEVLEELSTRIHELHQEITEDLMPEDMDVPDPDLVTA
ncbi:MAG: hypothetical protein JNJ77_19860 [Planctomycetia bacterium]|nr:hypothetical protein [Planctomycetia bacterium]